MGFGKISKRNDTFTAFRYKIVGVNATARRFFVHGDQTHDFNTGDEFLVSATVMNNGTYTVTSCTYDTTANRTRIGVAEEFNSSDVEGIIDLTTKEIPWQTGDIIVVNSTKYLPTPLYPNTAYYIIRKSSTRFALAETKQNADDGIAIVFTSNGDGFLSVAQVESSFRVFNGAGNTGELWFHLAVDKNDVRSFSPPQTVVGMQNFVNVMDGYAAYQHDTGIIHGVGESNDFDPVTGRIVDWRLETERFMDWAFGVRSSRMVISDTFHVSASASTDTITFVSAVPMWLSGTAVSVTSSGLLPSPLIAGSKYFVVLTGTPGQIKLSTSPTVSDTSAIVDLTSSGSGTISIGLYDKQRAFPRFELNPGRNNLWIETPQGVLSDVITGPYSDIRIQQSIFDQYNRPISANDLTVLRQDKRSRIQIRPEIGNDVDPIYANDPYNYIHFGGAHLFIEGYEHFLLLNNYTVSGALLYDPFLGLSTNKYNVDYYEKTDYTLRPTLGGYYLVDNEFKRNMEGSASDLQNVYDALALSEATQMAQHARSLVGYKGRTNFLDLLNVNSKSQFQFYRGMVQSKGSINSVKAYINSRRFVGAQLDEFWAWKLADFGDSRPKTYPELNLFLDDGRRDIRLEFIGLTESTVGTPDVEFEYGESVGKGFDLVTFKDDNRWYEAPDQKQRIESPLFLDAEVSSMMTIQVSTTEPLAHQATYVDYWLSAGTLWSFNSTTGHWTVPHSDLLARIDSTTYIKLDTIADDVRVVRRNITNNDFTAPNDYTNQVLQKGVNFDRVNASVISFPTTELNNIITIFTINPASTKISPARLIDKITNVVMHTVPLWHPARGDHYPHALRGITLRETKDPANYTTTLSDSDSNLRLNPWNHAEVGNVWWDTSRASYKSYSDDKVHQNINDRLRLWGNLSDFGDIDIFEWVESTVPPSEWDNLVASQATDSSIPHARKATGTPRKTVFRRSRTPHTCSVVNVNGSYRISVPSNPPVDDAQRINNNDRVIFTSTGTLPTELDEATQYIVAGLSSDNTFYLVDPESGNTVPFTQSGSGVMTVVKEFGGWKKQPVKHVRTHMPFVLNVNDSNQVVAWHDSSIDEWEYAPASTTPDRVDVYINDKLVEANLPVYRSGTTNILYVTLTEHFNNTLSTVFDIIRPLHTITDDDLEFDADVSDDGTQTVQWKEDYEYTITTKTTANVYGEATDRTYYYFWVQDTTTRDQTVNGSLSVKQMATYLTAPPTPYFIVQKPKDDPESVNKYTTNDFLLESYVQMPIFYRQLIIHKVASYIDDDRRYTIQFTRDHTLRDKLDEYHRQNNIKDSHEQWVLFRKEQTSSIAYALWNKLTESLVGYSVDSHNVKTRVPSLERELYDATYNAATRIGLGVGQTFVDRELGLNTVVKYLKDPTHNFSPANIDDFFANHSFDTPENIRTAMDVIYNTFGSVHVNRMWFEALHDSMSLNRKYHDLMKTSWIALHGVRVLEVGGLFDD